MAIEQASIQAVRKPWGCKDLRPWNGKHLTDDAIGELWFQRVETAQTSTLLLKLLFTSEPLSIQVHPDDDFARSIGLPHGKTEAWYILAAEPNARVAVGLKRELSAAQLRASIDDGSISNEMRWCPVAKDDVIFVPAGTIHAIGAGLVVAEIQQRSDATFRLFDHGRRRELHAINAVAAATLAPAGCDPAPRPLNDARTVLVANPHFVLERIELAPHSAWTLSAEQETWVLVLAGNALIDGMDASIGQAFFLEAASATLRAGTQGLKGLVAYVGAEPRPDLLQERTVSSAVTATSQMSRESFGNAAPTGLHRHSAELCL